MTNQIHETVREHYAKSALQVLDQGTQASCCGDGCCNGVSCTDPNHASDPNHATEHFIDPVAITFYSDAERAALPDQAVLASLGCGNPLAVADLLPGERVLDLGSGGGIDVLLSAQRVGPEGRAIGLDMTDEMLALARANAQAANATNVEFLKGHIEAIPLPADSIDVVISNCVVNLAADKPAVFAEIARVLRPGGRIGITDIVADDTLTPDQRAERGSYAGCIAGALSISEMTDGLTAAGLTDVSVQPTHEAAPGMYSAIIRATKPRAA